MSRLHPRCRVLHLPSITLLGATRFVVAEGLAGGLGVGLEALDDVGMLGGELMLLGEVGLDVVEGEFLRSGLFGGFAEAGFAVEGEVELPIALTHGLELGDVVIIEAGAVVG